MSRPEPSPQAPPALPESERRAWLAALGVTLWVPRADAPAAASAANRGDDVVEPVGDPGVEAAAEATSVPAPDPVSPAAVETTVERADGATGEVATMDWPRLRSTVLTCRQCGLCEERTQAVFGVGNERADLLVIGEAPGQEEDRRGEPFVGPAGQLLDRMLAAIQLDRQQVYITNILKCRPPRNRDPRADEAEACAPYLRRQIELMQPRVILAVGRVSAQQLLATDETIGRLRGHWHQYGPMETPVRVTYHPAYLLRKPQEKAKSWADLKQVRAALRAPA